MCIAEIKQSVAHRLFMAGYAGRTMPRWIRHIIAGSTLHRAWFLGQTRHFEEMGTRYGLANPYTPLTSTEHQQ